jgi:predicted aldo/keto reductase-like oxidoreductase
MKRREFVKRGTAGVAGAMSLGLVGCGAAMKKKEYTLWKEQEHFIPRPKGTMPMRELGSTGMKLSKFGFGSHIRKDIISHQYQREYLIREAHDLGINIFDVYDNELECYQYEPMGRYLEPIRKDIHISLSLKTYDGRTFEQEFERYLRLFKTDYIDMVRTHAFSPDHERWADHWEFAEKLFRYKEKGLVRAVGTPIHDKQDLDVVFDTYPMDYVLFPYNFYHNICWLGEKSDTFDTIPEMLHKKGVGVMTMKAFAGDFLVRPFSVMSRDFVNDAEVRLSQAALKYVINSEADPDCTVTGMYSLAHVYENIGAFYNPAMSDEEKALLENIRKAAKYTAKNMLPEHYKWLDNWAHTQSAKKPCLHA